MKKEYWFPTAFSSWGDEEREAMARVIASNRFTMGEETEAFEAELAAFNHRKHAVCVNSGSSANLIAVAAMTQHDVKPFRALVPALAWGTTYAPLLQLGVTDLALLDCDDSWCAERTNKKENFSVACSILGNPADQLNLEKADLNDDCEAFGATIDGKPTASFGTIATQSFFWSHQLGAIEGGTCLTDDDELYELMRCLRDHGLTRHKWKAPYSFDEEYCFTHFGYNVRPVEMHMAIAREQLKKAAMHRTSRRKNWNVFVQATTGIDRFFPIKFPQMREGANPFGLHFEVEDVNLNVDQQNIRRALAAALRENDIDCRLPTGGSFRLHPYGKPWADQQTPRADRIHRTGMFLGNAPYDISDKIEKAVEVMREVLS
jgi:CDP-6-deoxy-D-xylo-4-hexulose-3-dehydrase